MLKHGLQRAEVDPADKDGLATSSDGINTPDLARALVGSDDSSAPEAPQAMNGFSCRPVSSSR